MRRRAESARYLPSLVDERTLPRELLSESESTGLAKLERLSYVSLLALGARFLGSVIFTGSDIFS